MLALVASVTHFSSQAKAAPPTFKWIGDIRVRVQYEARDTMNERLSGKIRARLGTEIILDPEVRAVIRLATTKSNRSTNQTLGDASEPGAQRRFIGLDLAYAEWSPLSSLKLYVGRIPQTQIKIGGSQIILDDDLALEGFATTIKTKLNPDFTFNFHASSTWIRENYDSYYSSEAADNMLNSAQLSFLYKQGAQSYQAGLGFFNFTSIQGMAFSDLSVGGGHFGNTEKPAGIVKNEYLPREYFVEWKAPLGSMTSTVFLQHVVNSMTQDPNRAWFVGWNLTENGVWDMTVAFATLEKDAVPGVFTDSDFANGTTDSRGFMVSSRWMLSKTTNLRLTQFLNRIERTTRDLEYLRTHLDLSASF